MPAASPASPEAARFTALVAARIRSERLALTARWLERIVARVNLAPGRVFPSDELLDHMPLIMDGIADFLAGTDAPIPAQGAVLDRARELGALRFTQGFAEHELQKEYEILGGILFTLVREIAAAADAPSTDVVLGVAHRVFQAVAHVQQATTAEYLRYLTSELREREERLHAFHRALTHEIRNRIGATLGAGQLLTLEGLPSAERDRLASVIVRNAEGMRTVLDNLLELARERVVPRQQQHVLLPAAGAEVVRQLREAAEHAGVAVRLEPLPPVEVNAAGVELCLANLLSNAVKYADPGKAERRVVVRARVSEAIAGGSAEVRVEVADNGIGVPEAARARLFERFFRAHEGVHAEVPGTGLGLSIVREVAESLGGRAWAEFPPEGGSTFVLALPCRRAVDAAVVGAGSAAPALPG